MTTHDAAEARASTKTTFELCALLLACFALVSCHSSDSPPPSPAASDAAASSSTLQSSTDSAGTLDLPEQSLSLKLASGWKRVARPTKDPAVFRRSLGLEQLTVTALPSPTPMDATGRFNTLASLVEDRRSAEKRGMGTRGAVGEPKKTEQGDTNSARYDGFDPESNRRFATMVTVAPSHAWVLSFEGTGLTEQEMRADSKAVFDGVTLRDTPSGDR
jgi:hypothetical protein